MKYVLMAALVIFSSNAKAQDSATYSYSEQTRDATEQAIGAALLTFQTGAIAVIISPAANHERRLADRRAAASAAASSQPVETLRRSLAAREAGLTAGTLVRSQGDQAVRETLEQVLASDFRGTQLARVEAELAELSARSNGAKYFLVSRTQRGIFRVFQAASGVISLATIERTAVATLAAGQGDAPICVPNSTVCEPASFWRAMLNQVTGL